jgi:hypothetical protein
MLFYGGELQQPIVLDDSHENLVLLSDVAKGVRMNREVLRGRPYIDVALFWRPRGATERNWSTRLLSPKDAETRARFYPSAAGRPPLWATRPAWGTTPPRTLSARSIEILAAHGVPTDSANPAPFANARRVLTVALVVLGVLTISLVILGPSLTLRFKRSQAR